MLVTIWLKERGSLERHKRRVHDGFRYECDWWKSSAMSWAHKRSKHDMINNHCDQGESVFEMPDSLRTHKWENIQ